MPTTTTLDDLLPILTARFGPNLGPRPGWSCDHFLVYADPDGDGGWYLSCDTAEGDAFLLGYQPKNMSKWFEVKAEINFDDVEAWLTRPDGLGSFLAKCAKQDADEKSQALGFRDAAHHDEHQKKMGQLAVLEAKLISAQYLAHTPGPWTVSGLSIVSRLVENYQAEYHTQVASIKTKRASEAGDALEPMPECEQMANACLIAAAPELYHAAGMLADVSEVKLAALTHEQLKNLVRDLAGEARAAIAKAEAAK